MSDKNVERASKLDTATISDALDKYGLNGACYKIAPRDGSFRMAGRAYTLMSSYRTRSSSASGNERLSDVMPWVFELLGSVGRGRNAAATVDEDALARNVPPHIGSEQQREPRNVVRFGDSAERNRRRGALFGRGVFPEDA